MKIAHISDIHIRNFKYHVEYRRVFENLYRELKEQKPDLIVNTGDTGHTKTQISPEFVEMLSQFMRRLAEIAPLHTILGNHDMSLMNLSRQDAITPVIESIGSERIFLHKKSGRHAVQGLGIPLNFWVFSLADQGNYPRPSDWSKHKDEVNIGLFHGSVLSCVTDSNWRMTHVEHDLSIFDGLDYALMGDIHKQQFFNDRRFAYAGSLIQQNFGEELDKGFLLWEFDDEEPKTTFTVKPLILTGSRKFYTIHPKDDLTFPEVTVEPDSHIRISPPFPLTLVQQREVEKKAKQEYVPHDVITLSATGISDQRTMVGKKSIDHENLREIGVQERLITNFFKDNKISVTDSVMSKVLDLNRKFQIHIDQNDDSGRDIVWKVNKIGWSNFFNYGKDNYIDFSQLNGLTGIFAPNGSGKSNMIDILTLGCFDHVTKGVSKNIFLINDNKALGSTVVDVTANGQEYLIERNIERIKYGHRKYSEAKEWGKTTVSFSMLDQDGGTEKLDGTLRPETESSIRQRLGTFEDFMLTTLVAQWNQLDLIACSEARRREIFFKFFDLDIFGEKNRLAKDEYKGFAGKLNDTDESELEENRKKLELMVQKIEKQVVECNSKNLQLKSRLSEIDSAIETKNKEIVQLGKIVPIESSRSKLLILKRDNESLSQERLDTLSDLQKIEDDISQVPISVVQYGADFLADARALLKTLEEDEFGLETALGRKKVEFDQCTKSVEILSSVPCGDSFPTCRFLLDGFEARGKIDKISSEYADLKKQWSKLDVEIDRVLKDVEQQELAQSLEEKRDSLQREKSAVKLKLENLDLKLSALYSGIVDTELEISRALQLESDVIRNDAIAVAVEALKNEKLDIEEQIEENDRTRMELHRSSGNSQATLDKTSSDLAKISETRDMCTAYERYIDAMGKDGIAYNILTQKLPILNEEINKILLSCADFGVFVESDPEDQSIRFFLQYGEYKSRLLELGGGAEKFLASLAIRTALLNISNLPKTNMLLIDEGFGKLDSRNVENVQRMFDYLKTVFDHVLIVSHMDTMKDLVDNVIEITTDDEGYAHVEIGAN